MSEYQNLIDLLGWWSVFRESFEGFAAEWNERSASGEVSKIEDLVNEYGFRAYSETPELIISVYGKCNVLLNQYRFNLLDKTWSTLGDEFVYSHYVKSEEPC